MLRFKKRSITFLTITALTLNTLPPVAFANPPATVDRQTADQLRELQEALRRRAAAGQSNQDDASALESYTTHYFAKVWKEPVLRYAMIGLLIREVALAASTVMQMQRAMQLANRDIGSVAGVAQRLGPATGALSRELHDLTRTLTTLSDPTARLAQVRAAYDTWRAQAVAEANVLRAAGRTRLVDPKTSAELSATAGQKTEALLQSMRGEMNAIRSAGMRQAVDEARRAMRWNRGGWAKVRTGLVIAVVPLILVGSLYATNRELERNRRIEALNRAAEQDAEMMLNSIVLYFQRPILKSIVKAWDKVKRKDRSIIAVIPCPYALRGANVPNPDLAVIGALAMQIMIDMTTEGVDVVTINGQATPAINYEFFNRMFRRIIASHNQALNNLDAPTRDGLLRDLAYEAFHYYDTDDEDIAAPDPVAPPAPLGLAPR